METKNVMIDIKRSGTPQ